MPEIKIDPNSNVMWLGTIGLEAHADRINVLQDDFLSGYECEACKGKGEILCTNCKGTGKSAIVKDGKCTICNAQGKLACSFCQGKGGVIIVPEAAKNRPTTGTVVSVGERVTKFVNGDKVMYPSFAGHAFDLAAVDVNNQPVLAIIVILREDEVLNKIHGRLELKQVRKSAALGTVA